MQQRAVQGPVVAIGLDSVEFSLLNRWADAGHLPNIERIMASGAVSELRSGKGYTAETPWTIFLSGCRPETTGYWSTVKYMPDYRIEEVGAYDYRTYGHFYDYCRDRKVIALDVPHARKSEAVDGIQLLAWGAHSPLGPSESVPESFFSDVVERYGTHPALHKDDMLVWETEGKLEWLEDALVTGIKRRTRLCLDLMQSRPWDLLLVVFGEPHSAGHHFWHLSQPDHPLFDAYADASHDPLLNVLKTLDEAVGEIARHVPEDAYLVLFSPEGMKTNSSDLPSWLFLPELLHRDSFDGRAGLAKTPDGAPLPPLGRHDEVEWMRALWSLREDSNPVRRFARSRLKLRATWHLERLIGSGAGPAHPLNADRFRYMPQMWYRHLWPEMKAFALPSFSDGYVRINVRGREAAGKVDPSDYDRVCDEISDLLHELRDARTGRPVVREILRTRRSADEDERLPDADLIVFWTDTPTDTVESARYGRIGPAPFRRTGDHLPRGFFAASGPGIPAGRLPTGDLVDLAPTLLDLMGVPVPNHFDGRVRTPLGATSL